MPHSEQIKHDLIRDGLAPREQHGERAPVGALELDLLDARPKDWMVANDELRLVHAVTSRVGLQASRVQAAPAIRGTPHSTVGMSGDSRAGRV